MTTMITKTSDDDHLMISNRKKDVFHNSQLLLDHKQRFKKQQADVIGAGGCSSSDAAGSGKR